MFSGWMMETVTSMETGLGVVDFGLVDFEVSLRWPRDHRGLELGMQPWPRNINLGICGAWLVFEAMEMKELT